MIKQPPIRTWTADDYATRLDPQMLAFIAATQAHDPQDAINRTIAEQRAAYDRMCAAFRAARPAHVVVENAALPTPHPIPARHYRCTDGTRPDAKVLYLHGGGLVLGGLDSHDDICAEICALTGFHVTAAEYRLLPEHAYADACEDALDALRWLCADSIAPVIVVGDSAGALLGAIAVHAMRGEARQAAGQVLVYPGLGGAAHLPSRMEHAQAPMLTAADVSAYEALCGLTPLPPLQQTDFTGLPPTVLIPAECDPLRDDALAYDAAIRGAGGRSTCAVQRGWVHGGLRARHSADPAQSAFARMVAAIAAMGRGRWPA